MQREMLVEELFMKWGVDCFTTESMEIKEKVIDTKSLLRVITYKNFETKRAMKEEGIINIIF